MTRVISPALQFTGLSEAEVMTALNDPDPGNPIGVIVARLIDSNFTGWNAEWFVSP